MEVWGARIARPVEYRVDAPCLFVWKWIVDVCCLAPEFVEIKDQLNGTDVRRYGALKYSSPEQRECRASIVSRTAPVVSKPGPRASVVVVPPPTRVRALTPPI